MRKRESVVYWYKHCTREPYTGLYRNFSACTCKLERQRPRRDDTATSGPDELRGAEDDLAGLAHPFNLCTGGMPDQLLFARPPYIHIMLSPAFCLASQAVLYLARPQAFVGCIDPSHVLPLNVVLRPGHRGWRSLNGEQ